MRDSDCVCSRNARRERTTLLRFLSSSIIRASTCLPMYGVRSRTRRISTSDAGKKPRRPISTMRPPFTTSITVPITTSSRSFLPSISPHARSYCARFLERIKRPSLSSFCKTRASIVSPTFTISFGSASWRIDNSRDGITPSVLYPISTSTSSRPT
ncbi:unannotated protein [freshwater metagenome]|uniref:Unannotated protein n=1 Tax=freshwater metagenome TaxID=449393 RepID=A0A6J7AA83_9ZZZZ